MRIYQSFKDAVNETRRDLKEMGIVVETQTWQNKISGPEDKALELQFYSFAVTHPDPKDLNPTQPWADAEFEERVSGRIVNPGKAWRLRPKVWEQFLEKDRRFSYSYAQRFNREYTDGYDRPLVSQLSQVVENIKKYPTNRNHILTVWGREDLPRVGERRVPCSLFYHFLVRDGELMMHYVSRSCDMLVHMENDLYLAAKLQAWVAEKVGQKPGRFVFTADSLHCYLRNLTGTF